MGNSDRGKASLLSAWKLKEGHHIAALARQKQEEPLHAICSVWAANDSDYCKKIAWAPSISFGKRRHSSGPGAPARLSYLEFASRIKILRPASSYLNWSLVDQVPVYDIFGPVQCARWISLGQKCQVHIGKLYPAQSEPKWQMEKTINI